MATVAGLLLVGVGLISARGRAAPAALRDLVLPAPLHLPGHRAGVQPPVRRRGRVRRATCTARLAWSALYIVVAAAAALVPVGHARCGSALRHRLRVVGGAPRGADVVSVYIGGRHLDELRAESGPVLPLAVPRPASLWWASHPYSLSAPPQPDRLRITVKDRRRPQPGAGRAAARAPGCWPKARTARSPPRGAGAPGAADRRRRRHHPAAGPVRDHPCRPGDITLIYRASRARRPRVPRRARRHRPRTAAPPCTTSSARRDRARP